METSNDPVTKTTDMAYSNFANTSKDPAAAEERMLIEIHSAAPVQEDTCGDRTIFTTLLDGKPFKAETDYETFLFEMPGSIFPKIDDTLVQAHPKFGHAQTPCECALQTAASIPDGRCTNSVPFEIWPEALYEYSLPSELYGDLTSRYFVPEKPYRLNTKSREFQMLPDKIAESSLKFISQAETDNSEGFFLEEVFQDKNKDEYREQWHFETFLLEEIDTTSRDLPNERPLIRHYMDGNYRGELSMLEAKELIDTFESKKTYFTMGT